MEIERKFLVDKLPDNLEQYPCHQIEQAYLCTEPVIRIRKIDEQYILTCKSKGLMVREEYELPLTKTAYEHLLTKIDGIVLKKTRYKIPYMNQYTIELDIFSGEYDGLVLAETEFPDEKSARDFIVPEWFGTDVTFTGEYQNNVLSLKEK